MLIEAIEILGASLIDSLDIHRTNALLMNNRVSFPKLCTGSSRTKQQFVIDP